MIKWKFDMQIAPLRPSIVREVSQSLFSVFKTPRLMFII